MSVVLEKLKGLPEIPEALLSIIGTEDLEVFRFVDNEVDGSDPKVYNAYKIVAPEKTFVLKKSDCAEDFESEKKHYALLSGLPVPEFFGAEDGHILLGFVEGSDLLNASDEGVVSAAKSLAEIMNAYPMGRNYEQERYLQYLRRLEKRADFIKDEPELSAAFAVFFEREREIPLTLSNGDLLPINVIFDGEKTTIIDWGFGGFMPYALDIARFVAHGRVSGKGSPFRMTDAQKNLFIDTVYESLEEKPERPVFDRDVLLAEYNELVEILEYYFREKDAPREDTFRDYYPRAKALAERITAEEGTRGRLQLP